MFLVEEFFLLSLEILPYSCQQTNNNIQFSDLVTWAVTLRESQNSEA